MDRIYKLVNKFLSQYLYNGIINLDIKDDKVYVSFVYNNGYDNGVHHGKAEFQVVSYNSWLFRKEKQGLKLLSLDNNVQM